MEFIEYVPGGMAAAWMVFRMAILLRKGAAAATMAKPSKPSLHLV